MQVCKRQKFELPMEQVEHEETNQEMLMRQFLYEQVTQTGKVKLADWQGEPEDWLPRCCGDLIMDVLDGMVMAKVDLRLPTRNNRPFMELFVMSPWLIKYKDCMIGFSEELLLDYIMETWLGSTRPKLTVELVVLLFTARVPVPLMQWICDRKIFGNKALFVEMELYNRIWVRKENVGAIICTYEMYGQRSVQFAELMCDHFDMAPNVNALEPGRDDDLIQWCRRKNCLY